MLYSLRRIYLAVAGKEKRPRSRALSLSEDFNRRTVRVHVPVTRNWLDEKPRRRNRETREHGGKKARRSGNGMERRSQLQITRETFHPFLFSQMAVNFGCLRGIA